jgi:hypothetical protein
MRRGLPALSALVALATVMLVTPACGAAALATAAPASRAAAPAPQKSPLPVLDDLRGPLAREAALGLPLFLGARGALPSAKETGAYAAGRIAVSVVFVESNGAIDPNRENWSRPDPRYPGRDRRTMVLAKIQAALDWWNARSPDGSLQLFLPASGQYGAPRTLATGYEPITRPTSMFAVDYRLSDAAWRWQVMSKLGFAHVRASDSPPPERAYADRTRSRNGADFAFVVYVVDSLRDTDGAFADGAIAYTSDLFGPYTVLTYDNDGYSFANFDAVLAHEMGHQFGALDEYAPPWPGYPSTGAFTSGYLGVRNRNAVIGGSTALPCIMRGSQGTLDAFAAGDLCPSTIGQTGLRDRDADTHPDVVDTQPGFRDGPQAVAADGRVTVTGTVRERPCPRGRINFHTYFRHNVSIAVPHDLRFRVDGADPWQDVTPVDGSFDRPSEKWSLTTGPLADGHHTLEVQGTTGGTVGFSRDLWVGATPVTLDLAVDAAFTAREATITAGHTVRFYVSSASGGLPVPYLDGVTLGRASAGSAGGTAAATDRGGRWTGLLKPLRSGDFVARFAGAGVFLPAAPPAAVAVHVRTAIRASAPAGPFRLGRQMRVHGAVKPLSPGAAVSLEETRDGGVTWKPVASAYCGPKSRFVLVYATRHHGAVHLRVRCAATATNLGNTLRLPVFRVL